MRPANVSAPARRLLRPTCVFLCGAIISAWQCGRSPAAEGPIAVKSPNGRQEIRLDLVGGQLVYQVLRDGQNVVENSAIRPMLESGGPATIEKLVEADRGAIDQTSPLPWGKSNTLVDQCNYAVVDCRDASQARCQVDLRAYNDGVAFRYRIPTPRGETPATLLREETEFRPAGDATAFFNTLDGFQTSHESLYERRPWREIPAGRLIDCPLLLVWADGKAAAITEARVRHFAGMYLERSTSDATTLLTRLSPLPGNDGVAVVAKGPLESPWRVILLGDSAGALQESNLLLCLNDPPRGDFTWVRPGKTTFHWWNGEFENDYQLADESETFVNRHRKYIDFCARHGMAYHGLSGDGRPWYPQSSPDYAVPSADADVRKTRPELKLPEIFAYARERGVGIRLWVHWKPLSEHLEEAFAQYEAWGVTGLMVDFLDRDDQEMLAFEERVLECASRHKLNIQFHGSSKNSGEQRTFPDLVNREGVLNLEYLKWSARCTPDHNVNVAYTRALTGPVDYHLGGFHSVSRAAFQPVPLNPVVLGTRCHHLALYLIYENPLPMLADKPDNYEGQPGFDFLCRLPTTWDETRFVAGEAGEFIVLARRRGNTWYLGGITNWTPRQLSVPLSFLGRGEYTTSLYVDGSQDENSPNEVQVLECIATAAAPLNVSLAPGGGLIGAFTPK